MKRSNGCRGQWVLRTVGTGRLHWRAKRPKLALLTPVQFIVSGTGQGGRVYRRQRDPSEANHQSAFVSKPVLAALKREVHGLVMIAKLTARPTCCKHQTGRRSAGWSYGCRLVSMRARKKRRLDVGQGNKRSDSIDSISLPQPVVPVP